MINNRADYRFVQGDISSVIIDGGIMPLRSNKKQLRGEDLCFVAEAHEQRTDLWNGAIIYDSPRYANSGYTQNTITDSGQTVLFQRKLSFTQLATIAVDNYIDITKTPGSGSASLLSKPFFVRRWPNEVLWNSDWNTTRDAISSEWASNLYSDAQELLQHPNNLNGRKLLQSEVSGMIEDTKKFQIAALGYEDMMYGYSIGMTTAHAEVVYQGQFDPNNYPPSIYTQNSLWAQNAQNVDSSTAPNGLIEVYPNSGYTPAKFKDNGDVTKAEYWGLLIAQYEAPLGSSIVYRIAWRKIADMILTDGWWKVSMTSSEWKNLCRSLFRQTCGRLPINDYTQLQNTNFDYSLKLYYPHIFVQSGNRFKW